ncbi:transcriptional regulator [Bradyrhizobium sp. UFLA05-153]
MSSRPVFTRREFREIVSPGQPLSSADSLLKYHVSTGRILHAASGVYAAVPPHLIGKPFQPDRLLVASRIREDSVLAFHTALELHGLSYSEGVETQILSKGRPGELKTRVGMVRFVAQPAALRRSGRELDGTVVLDRRGLDIRVTSLERTLVDCVERPDLAGGNEELSNALQTVSAIEMLKLVELVLARENQSVAGVLGCWLESRREDLLVDDGVLEELKRSAPSSTRPVLGATIQAGEPHPNWKVILPNEFLRPSFEGGSPEMTS